MHLRSFLYLDEYKLYSFSSQLFAGLTEYIVNYSNNERRRDEERTLASSAKLVAEIAMEHSATQERRFLHDHAYNLFEKELTTRGALLTVDSEQTLADFAEPRFVRVSGPATIIDAPMLKHVISTYNDLGTSLSYVMNISDILKAREELTKLEKDNQDRNKKVKIAEIKRRLSAEELAKSSNLHQDPEMLARLASLIEYGFQDQLQFQVPKIIVDGDVAFSAVLRRDCLRETERAIVHKYARRMDREVTIVGIPTQSGDLPPPDDELAASPKHIKAAVAELASRLAKMEQSFSGRLPTEVIIDPIAVYVEMSIEGGPTHGA